MAITALEYLVMTDLGKQGLLPEEPDLLELGPQNWYGDVSFKAVETLARDLLSGDEDGFQAFRQRYEDIVGQVESGDVAEGLRRFCRLFYRLLFAPRSYTAIDLADGPDLIRHDLNHPIEFDRQFHIVTNIGTAEHVFDVGQVFRTVHEAAAPGALMIHTAPFTGWWNHGFFAVQPTLYFDLAEANGYDLVSMTYATLKPFEAVRIAEYQDIGDLADAGRIGHHAVINCVLRKGPENKAFENPIQRVYSGRSSERELADWRKHR
ncbi:MAG: hypothetical protein MI741_24385 [Rhodospirillales bacterium]|nr:hypothetical protein [Rhodospirillales bacterium]